MHVKAHVLHPSEEGSYPNYVCITWITRVVDLRVLSLYHPSSFLIFLYLSRNELEVEYV